MKTYNILKNKAHNPHCKLASVKLFVNGHFVQIVYAISNEGTNEGLEVYYFKTNEFVHHHYSRRFIDNIPSHYQKYFDYLKQFDIDGEIPKGHKIEVKMPY